MKKVNEFIKYLKELWSTPRGKALIKLSVYGIFIFMLFLFSGINNHISNNSNNKESIEEKDTFQSNVTYKSMQYNLTHLNYEIKYDINYQSNKYSINGTLKNNVLEGYLESITGIKKIVFEDNQVYEIIDGNKVLLDIGSMFDINVINLNNLFNILSNTRTIMETKENSKIYKYVLLLNNVEYNVEVEINKDDIYKISLISINSNILLSFDNITK